MKRFLLLFCLLGTQAHADGGADKQAAANKLLDALRTAPTEERAAALEQQIEHLWLDASTPAAILLVGRGMRILAGGSQEEAEAAFADAITLDPSYAEAWHHRAIARFHAGDSANAVRDLQKTLALEPRHFGAWQTLEQIAAARSDWKGAYDAMRHVLEIDPRTPKGEEHLKDLKRKAFGDNA